MRNLSILCVFAELGVFARNLTHSGKPNDEVSRKDAKIRKDAKLATDKR
jgi:hypothetical protein